MAESETIRVSVAYATPTRQALIDLTLPAGSSAGQAIDAAGMAQQFPDIDLAVQRIGLFGQVCTPDKILVDGDRVEIYRTLQQDPMAARRRRLAKT